MTAELRELRDHGKITLAQFLAASKKVKQEVEYITIGNHGVLRIFVKHKIIGFGRNGKIAYRVDRHA